MHFDNELKFEFHIEKIRKNANRKTHVLTGVTSYMYLSKKGTLINALFDPQYNCCPKN